MLQAADTMKHGTAFFLILLSRGHDEALGRKGQFVFTFQWDMEGQKGLVISLAVPTVMRRLIPDPKYHIKVCLHAMLAWY